MAGIEAKNYNLRHILREAHYQIEYYQREYAWGEREVAELLDDLFLKFRESYNPNDESNVVSRYKEYFLGSIVVTEKEELNDGGKINYIVDGQQRLTTLVLLFTYIYKRLDISDVKRYISSSNYGKEQYNIYVRERTPIMDYILSDDNFEPSAFVANHRMKKNYDYIQEYFEFLEITDKELEFFYYWIEHQVLMIKITVEGGEEAYTIFESMNDRGRPLTNSEMLKGYILSLIDDRREDASELWHSISRKFKNNSDFDDFLILLFRSKYATTVSDTYSFKKENRANNDSEINDYTYIGKSYYKFIKENRNKSVGILNQYDAYIFLENLDYYSDLFFYILEKETKLHDGYEGIYYIGKILPPEFYILFIGAISPHDEQKDEKIKVISKFLDIRSGLFSWNMGVVSSSTNLSRYLISLLKELRSIKDKDLLVLISVLYNEIIKSRDTETGWRKISEETAPSLSDNKKKNIKYILARVTEYLETGSGKVSIFSEIYGKNYEIEHILAANYRVNSIKFSSQEELEIYRDKIGALGILEKSINSSLGDMPYNYKVNKYTLNNIYLGTLNESLYDESKERIVNIPGLTRIIEKNPSLKGLIKPYSEFGKNEILERNKLITEISKIIWNPNDFQLFLNDYNYDIDIEELGEFVGVEVNHDNIPIADPLEIDNKYGFPIDDKLFFEIEGALCEFSYAGRRKINLLKIRNAQYLKNPEKVFKGSNSAMLEIYNNIIKTAVINENNTYNWDGLIENTVMLAPVYLVTGKNHTVHKNGVITIKKDYHLLQ